MDNFYHLLFTKIGYAYYQHYLLAVAFKIFYEFETNLETHCTIGFYGFVKMTTDAKVNYVVGRSI